MRNEMEIFYSLLMIPIAVIWAFENASRVRAGKGIDHTLEFALRATVAIAIMFIIYGNTIFTSDWHLPALFLLEEGFIFWAVFDPVINIFIFKDISKWLYRGKTSGVDIMSSKLKWLTSDLYFSIKIFIFGIIVFVYNILLN